MSELGDLLELLHGATQFRTVRAEFRVWRHDQRALTAFQAMAARSGGMVTMYAESEEGEEPPSPESESTARLWLELPDRVREERPDHLAVKDGERWWTWQRDWGASTNVGSEDGVSTSIGTQFIPLLAPARVLGALEWTAAGRGERAGRPVLLALAHPREQIGDEDDQLGWNLHPFGSGAGEYAFEVDVERGVLLRAEARYEGEPFQVVEVTDIAFDEDLPEETFVFEAPDGSQPEPFEQHFVRHRMPISELVERAGFTVLAPERVPEDWRLDSHWMPARERPPMAEHVTLFYSSQDGTGSVAISMSLPGDDDHEVLLRGEGWQEMESGGTTFRMRPRTRDWSQPQLYIEREGTAAMLTSDTLSNDELIMLALSLRPASGGSALASL